MMFSYEYSINAFRAVPFKIVGGQDVTFQIIGGGSLKKIKWTRGERVRRIKTHDRGGSLSRNLLYNSMENA